MVLNGPNKGGSKMQYVGKMSRALMISIIKQYEVLFVTHAMVRMSISREFFCQRLSTILFIDPFSFGFFFLYQPILRY